MRVSRPVSQQKPVFTTLVRISNEMCLLKCETHFLRRFSNAACRSSSPPPPMSARVAASVPLALASAANPPPAQQLYSIDSSGGAVKQESARYSSPFKSTGRPAWPAWPAWVAWKRGERVKNTDCELQVAKLDGAVISVVPFCICTYEF